MVIATNKKRLAAIKNKIISLIDEIIRYNSVEFDEKRARLFKELTSLLDFDDDYLLKMILQDKAIMARAHLLNKVFCYEQIAQEKYWCKLIVNESNLPKNLRESPFYSLFDKSSTQTSYIYHAIKIVIPKIKKLLYVGCGALPFNAILLSRDYNIHVDAIDKDPVSCFLFKKLIKKIHLNKKLHIIVGDVVNFKKIKNYDVIVVAVMVGKDPKEKLKIIENIYKKMNKNTILVVKNFAKMKSILYPSINIDELKKFNLKLFLERRGGMTNQLFIIKK